MILTRGCLRLRWSLLRSYSTAPDIRSITASRRAGRKKVGPLAEKDGHPTTPARTRFAPSPTGFVHLGSLRTALYNFLLARATGGQFLLRIEDTDQTRKKDGAEDDIYEALRWAGVEWDEGPEVGGECGPYRQSERLGIYKEYAEKLLESGHAYRCFCTKDRLDKLRDSAQKMKPPSMATYDRYCYHIDHETSAAKAASNEPFTIRLKAPESYPVMKDLLHGELDLQVQSNYSDPRYDDPVLFKTDGFPTYHLANVVDDHLMRITHVIRGEEWLPSTPKHLALYNAFGWTPPEFIHIPLLTSLEDKKLSKRTGDVGIKAYKENGILPEALVNFVALYGWSPPLGAQENGTNKKKKREATAMGEIMTMKDLIANFNLNGLTKGNAKVSESKLEFFNSYFLRTRIEDPEKRRELALEIQPALISKFSDISTKKQHKHKFEVEYIEKVLTVFKGSLKTLPELPNVASYAFTDLPSYGSKEGMDYISDLSITREGDDAVKFLQEFAVWWTRAENVPSVEEIDAKIKFFARESGYKPTTVFHALRFAIAGSVPGAPLPLLVDLLDPDTVTIRIVNALRILKL
ncbi:tRNA synthetases class I, catalytic domain-containing protein [Myxozyma melibiosi]|uniref:glutamate--tRNA ligase n=1 Tax=Myxozyma melibiosi TaxID=54550 RepID=A0ABR1F1K0_9ASCO